MYVCMYAFVYMYVFIIVCIYVIRSDLLSHNRTGVPIEHLHVHVVAKKGSEGGVAVLKTE